LFVHEIQCPNSINFTSVIAFALQPILESTANTGIMAGIRVEHAMMLLSRSWTEGWLNSSSTFEELCSVNCFLKLVGGSSNSFRTQQATTQTDRQTSDKVKACIGPVAFSLACLAHQGTETRGIARNIFTTNHGTSEKTLQCFLAVGSSFESLKESVLKIC
jgi:hypothetical protein